MVFILISVVIVYLMILVRITILEKIKTNVAWVPHLPKFKDSCKKNYLETSGGDFFV